MDTVLFKFQTFAFQPVVCEMGGYFWLQNGLELLCRLWPCGPRPYRRTFGLILKTHTIFKIYGYFFIKS